MSKQFQTDKGYYAELENNFLRHLGYEYTEFLCDELDGHKLEIDKIQTPETLNQWFHDFHRSRVKREKRQHRIQIFNKCGKRAAIILLVLIGMNFILVNTVEAYRINFMNTMTQIQDKFTQIDIFTHKPENDLIPSNWAGNYYLSYLPNGYKMEESTNKSSMILIKYRNSKGDMIEFIQAKLSEAIRMDSESGHVEEIDLDSGQKTYIVKKNGIKLIKWQSENMSFCLKVSNIDEISDMQKLVESTLIYSE